MTARTSDRTERPEVPPPWVMIPQPGAWVAVAAAAVMMTVSVAAWPDMAVEIVTREADGRHGASVVPRGVTAVALPLVLLVIVAALSVVIRLDHALLGRTAIGQQRSPDRARRVFSWTLMGLSLVLSVLHVGLVAMYTGTPFPLEQAVGVAVGVLLSCLGVAAPLAAPGGRLLGRAERFRAAQAATYRGAGILLAAAGVVTAFAAVFSVSVALWVAVVSVVLAFGWVGATAATKAGRRGPEA